MDFIAGIFSFVWIALLCYGAGSFLLSLNEDKSQNQKNSSFKTLLVGAVVLLPILYIGSCAGCGGSSDYHGIQKYERRR